jgi:kinesin family protein C2/C3
MLGSTWPLQVFGALSQEADVFKCVQPLLVSVLDGRNVCVMAYGQTGRCGTAFAMQRATRDACCSGKTHTMEGGASGAGVSMACAEELLRLAENRAGAGGVTYVVTASAYEIYNDQIKDLLGDIDAPPLQVHMQADGRSCLPGLTQLPAPDAAAVRRVLQHVKQRRATARTNMNASSSRSHTVVLIMCAGARDGQPFVCGRLNLVDLAGSERLGRSGSDGDAVALREAQAINGSLSALGDVMQALACRREHVPYRSGASEPSALRR